MALWHGEQRRIITSREDTRGPTRDILSMRNFAGWRALQPYTDTKDRPDEGGKRTFRLEYSTVEFRLDEGEKGDRSCSRRVSASRGIEFFTAEAFLKVGDEPEFEATWQPSEHWPCNEGRPHIAYNHAKSGAQDWETVV